MDCFACFLARCCSHSLGLPPQYGFVKRIGQGTEGDVWLCTDSERNCMVAVKLVPRGPPAWRLAMVGREGRLLARLGAGHVNIVRPLEVVLTSRHLAFVSEYVPGGSLSDHIGRAPMDEACARYFFRQLLAAIGFLHEHKVAYRDIKPANMLITTTNPPFIKLCDFGLAHSWAGKVEPTFETLAGTPGYMSPEIMGGFFAPDRSAPAPYDGVKADVYSAGVLLVVMLLHTMPWHYDTYASRLPPLEAMRAIYQLESVAGATWRDATSSAAKLSPELAGLLDGMLEPDMAKRLSLEAVAASAWVNLPLPPKLAIALEVLQEQQDARQVAAAAAFGDAGEHQRGLSEEELAARLAQFDSMLAAAEVQGSGYQLEQRLQLQLPSAQRQQRRRPTAPPAQQEVQREGSSAAAAAAAADG